ncbi:hypothetical protein GON03_12250 [Nocardioides sp. MAH-18]|uniref:DUF7144 domain-containing protein n=1 Tax=Nocardioides agri TaxID=2682843 RepID=A0A6L6XU12_9ACTN|nr:MULTISPECIES: hypothetical protein [unclassified Nocardioides]MBA2955103.1 hypothetical protein [Nocardioides sp. CGMCC 1.13656]MVQ49956.1 hypothetical protein [Nocardioides sp. MAH-18]
MSHPSSTESAWAEGIGIFAGAALLTVGIFQFLEGVAAAAKDDVFVRTSNYVFEFDLTTWGWIHIVLGIIVAIVGGAILASQPWAYVAGIVVAVLSALLNFVWMPYYPFWAVLIIAFDIAVIWALSTLLGSRRA